jgi:hypothetical protein
VQPLNRLAFLLAVDKTSVPFKRLIARQRNAAESRNRCLLVFREQLPGEGLEPTRIAPPDPKSGASANSAIRASLISNAQRN